MMAVTIPAMSKGSSLEDGNPSDWPSSFPEFKELEMILSCGICFEYLTTTMVTKCSHNFCSLCIRRYMCYKLQCPICKEPIFEHELRNNRIVDEIIQNFTQSRARVLALMRSDSSGVNLLNSATVGISKRAAVSNIPGTSLSSPDLIISAKSSEGEPLVVGVMSGTTFCSSNKNVSSNANDVLMLTSSPPSLLNADRGSDVAADFDDATNPAVDKCQIVRPVTEEGGVIEERSNQRDQGACTTADEKVFSSSATPYLSGALSPSPSSLLRSPEMSSSSSFFMSAPPVFSFGLQSPTATTVPCPVCNTDVPSRNINLHLDRCLESGKKNDPPANPHMKRKQLPKLVYTLLSDKDLRKRLTEVGLPTSGNRQAMVKRHHEFTLTYNAQCDSLNPKTVQEIVDEIIQNDAAKSRTPSRQVQSMPLKIDKHCSEEQVEKAQKEYVKQHKTQFSELVAAARRNRQDETRTVKFSTAIDLSGESASMNVNTVQDDDDDDDDFFCFGVGLASTSSSLSLDPHTITSAVDSENDENCSEPQMVGMSASKASESQSSSVSLEAEFDSVTDCKVVIRSRQVRRKLDQGAFSNVHENRTASAETAELDSENPMQSSVVTRRILRSCARKNKHSTEPPMPNELNEEFGDIIINDDERDDDYEIPASISGKKRKSGIQSKGKFKARKSENDAEHFKP